MAEGYYSVPSEPVYVSEIRKLQNSDPVSATDTFNPLIERLIENIAAVKKQAAIASSGSSGPFVFSVSDSGHLICSYTGTEPPEYYINDNGHLCLDIEEGT